MNANAPLSWKEVAERGRQARKRLEEAERKINKKIQALEDSAMTRGQFTEAERKRWEALDEKRKDVLGKKKRISDVTAMALDANRDVVKIRERFQRINRHLKKTKERLNDIAEAAKKVEKAIAVIADILKKFPIAA